MKILVTGAAGFIGAAVCRRLLRLGHMLVGLDNLNDYYDSGLKRQRLAYLQRSSADTGSAFSFRDNDICSLDILMRLFELEKFDAVIHLAAQAGVRYSLIKPQAYVSANLQGFLNMLECCRHHPVRHLLYASSSSVYGQNASIPFCVEDKTDEPLSLYAVSKKSNELMAHSYSHLFGIPATGLRFFTVYGPWGRPDMAPMLFAEAMLKNEPIAVFNHGKMQRDFTFIDDVVESVVRLLSLAPSGHTGNGRMAAPCRVLNCGRGSPVDLLAFIRLLASALGKQAILDFQGMQPGDVPMTWADTQPLEALTQFKPAVSIEAGVAQFAAWFMAWKNNSLEKSDSA
jgi:UDP-glucuronate 4-epimerase